MSAQLLQKIVNNFHTATQLHSELASAMWFIGMDGYAMIHELQFVEESNALRRVKKYIIETYDVYTLDEIPESANLAMPLIGDKHRRKLSKDDTVDILKHAWSAYEKWETQTLKLYSGIAVELFDNKDVAAHNLVSEIVNDVKQELNNLINMVMQLEAHSYDMPQIVGDQQGLSDTYRKKLNKLELGK